jgi:hypothetical protein
MRQDIAMTSDLPTNDLALTGSLERRLLDALHAARVRRERSRRRQEQRKSHWLSSFSTLGLERHHASETQRFPD